MAKVKRNYGLQTRDGYWKDWDVEGKTETIANPTYINVEDFGVKTTNMASDNDVAMIDAIDSMHTNKHGLQFGAGRYEFNAEWTETSYSDFFAIKGIGSFDNPVFSNGRTEIYRNQEGTLFTIKGESFLVENGTKRHYGAQIRDIFFHGTGKSSDLIRMFSCTEFSIERIKIEDARGVALHMWEFMDSRINDSAFEKIGTSDGNAYGIVLRSGTYDDGSGNVTREKTNEVYFTGCRWETFFGTALGTIGNDTNNIRITNCKFESSISNHPHVKFSNSLYIYLLNVFMFTVGDVGETIGSIISLDAVSNFYGYGLQIQKASGNADLQTLIAVNASHGIKIDLGTTITANEILSDYLIDISNQTSSSDYNFSMYNTPNVTKKLYSGIDIHDRNNEAFEDRHTEDTIFTESIMTDTTLDTEWKRVFSPEGSSSKMSLVFVKDGTTYVPYAINSNGQNVFQTQISLIGDSPLLLAQTASPQYQGVDGNGSMYVRSDKNAIVMSINGFNKTFSSGTTAPTSGDWDLADIIYNNNPTSGGYTGWICINGGTAGAGAVFKGFGLIEA